MAETDTRHVARSPARAAEGWRIERVTRPSRLFGANGIRAGGDGRIYVAQVAGSAVSAIDVDTGAIATISPSGGAIVGPDDLAFDDEGNIYLTEITLGQVSVLRPNGTAEVVRGDLPVVNPITWHQGCLIAGECRMGARIVELDRDGGAPRVILDDVPMANAFEVGPDGKLYFPVMAANEIWRVGLDGGAPEVVARDLGVPDAVKFHPDGYIVSTQVRSGQVLRIDPRTGDKTVLAELAPGLDNVAFVGRRTFVSHIAGSIHEIDAPGDARALVERGLQWPLGLTVAADGALFVCDGGFTYLIPPGGEPELAGMLFTPGFPGWTRDAAAAGPGEFIVTTALDTVARWRPGEQAHEVIASGCELPMGVDVGPRGAVVFAEAATGRVLSVENGAAVALAAGLDRPMGVAVVADAAYVAEAGAGRIVKLAAGRAETVLDGLVAPHGLAAAAGRLYAVDVGARQVVSCDLAGGDRRTIAAHLPVGAPPGAARRELGGIGDMCGPMHSFAGIAVAPDGTAYIAADAEGSVLALRRL